MTDTLKPRIYLYREPGDWSSQVPELLSSLGVDCDVFTEPRAFLSAIKSRRPAGCIVDFMAERTEVAIALTKAIRTVLGQTMPLLALAPKDGLRAHDAAALASVSALPASLIEPISAAALAQMLSKFLVTDAIALRLQPAAAAPVAGLPPAPDHKPFFKWLFEKVLPILVELQPQVRFFDQAERQLKFHAEQLKPIEDQIIEMVRRLRRKNEKLDLNQSLRAFGVANTRNLATTRALSQALMPGSFGFDPKTGLPTHDPKTYLHYAIRTVERFGEGSRFYQTAFSAGLVFDVLAKFAAELGERKRPVLKAFEAGHAEAIRRTEKGYKLGKQADDLAMARHILTTMMLREAGKGAMAIFFENYLEIRKILEKKTVSHAFQLIAEEENLSTSHNKPAALLAMAAPNLADAFLTCLICDIPASLKSSREKDHNALASFCRTL